tara:strand:- start:39 stop:143 length:105 start_codon:yes stop_codon:yes gene_type:complete
MDLLYIIGGIAIMVVVVQILDRKVFNRNRYNRRK